MRRAMGRERLVLAGVAGLLLVELLLTGRLVEELPPPVLVIHIILVSGALILVAVAAVLSQDSSGSRQS